VSDRRPWTPVSGRDAFTDSSPEPYPLNGFRVKGVGGSTLHWDGVTVRFQLGDLSDIAKSGNGRFWCVRGGHGVDPQ